MNFPGLDFTWRGAHQAARACGFVRPWTLEQVQAGVAKGENILVVASTALGDSLLTTPLLSTLAHHLGRDRVSLLVKAPFAELYRDDPRLHRVFTVRGKYRWDNLRAELRRDPHRVALLANVTEPDLVPLLWHAGTRGFLRHRSRWIEYPDWMANRSMLRHRGEEGYGSGHAIENNLAMAEALGLEVVTHRLSLPQIVRGETGPDRTVTIHAGASRANKRWPLENWARLADALAAELAVQIVFTGARGEETLTNEIIGRMKTKARSVAGLTPLPLLAATQAASAAFISGDTGPYHLAVAVGCPTVTLFAPTDRGSSVEACGPHESDAFFHRAIQTAAYGDSIETLSFQRVLEETMDVVRASLVRKVAT
jgi:heptosyltransferase-2/heptosyltransferase-3